MKRNPRVTSSHRKCHKYHFTVPSSVCHKYNMRSIPICHKYNKQVVRDTYKRRKGKVLQVYCRHWVIHVERITREKVNSSTINVDIHPSKVAITKIKLNQDRKALLHRKAHGRAADKAKGKFTDDDMAATAIGSATTGASLQEID